MINIPVQECDAYDLLATLEIVKRRLETKESIEAYQALNDFISNQLGNELHDKIKKSDEYFNLFYTSQEIFSSLEDELLNQKKLEGKTAFQNKFFPKEKN